jgi:UDP-glucose 4-epimerase
MHINFDKALVTGGAGFIGSHIVDDLVNRGCKVTVIDDLSTGNLSNLEHHKDRITFYRGDIRDRQLINRVIAGCDVVFHQAAVVSVPQTVENPVDSAMVNDIGTLHILEAARIHHVKRVVLASSCAVYGDDPRLPKKEEMTPEPLSPYAAQKLSAEFNARLYYRLYNLETVCLRYFNVYGPRQDPSSPYSGVISIFMTKAGSKKTPVIYGDGNQSRDFVFVKDVVKANLLAAMTDNISGKIFNVGTGKRVFINQLWEMICGLSNCKIEPQYQPARPGDVSASAAGIANAVSELGFSPEFSFENGLHITYEWYRKRGCTIQT